MAVEIVMPKLSDTMEEGTILKWRKRIGDAVSAGEVIAEVETDKADMELEASESGTLVEIAVPEGAHAVVGAVIARVEPAARVDRPSPAASAGETGDGSRPAPEAGTATAAESAPRRPSQAPAVKASDAARALAGERGVDLATLHGSGPAGRVVTADVARAAGAPATAEAAGGGVVERHDLSRMRKSIARRMSEAFREIPHFSVTSEIDMSEVVRLKAALDRAAVFPAPVSYTHLVLKATAVALTRHPRLNASYRDGGIEIYGDVNLGMAVAVDEGLIVPVLRRADTRSLADLAVEARRLAAQAKQGRFTSAELSGGTFTVSNLGMLDIERFTAVINPPQAAILAVGTIKPRPVVRDGALAVAHTMYVTVSCDHRIIDGVIAGRFLEELGRILENPIGLVVA